MKEDSRSTNKTKKNALQGQNVTKLANLRIIQKHLVYVIGLSSSLAVKEVKNNFYLVFYCALGFRKTRVFWTIRKHC